MPRRFDGPRTPRKDKTWATQNSGSSSDDIIGQYDLDPLGRPEIVADLLFQYQTELDIGSTQQVTAMRIFGDLIIGNGDAESVSQEWACSWGIAWVDGLVAAAPLGDAQIPNPSDGGLRQADWMQRGILYGTSTILTDTRYYQQDLAHIKVDITQQRRQMRVDRKLVFVTRCQFVAGGTHDPKVLFNLNTMLAL